MEFRLKNSNELPTPHYNLMRSPVTITSNLWGVKDYVYERAYSTPKNIESIRNTPVTVGEKTIGQREYSVSYFKDVPVYNELLAYPDNPGNNSPMNLIRPRRPEPIAEITCSQCCCAVFKYVERVRNNIAVSFRKLVYH